MSAETHNHAGDKASGLNISDLTLMPHAAIQELKRRQQDLGLKEKVKRELGGDIPEYFGNEPILYLARHIATPNFETLRFIHLIGDLGLKLVVTQDSKGLFVSQNLIKRALCKLPICKRITQKGDAVHEQYQKVTIADFSKIDGKTFNEIETLWGENIIDFHSRLFKELGVQAVETPDDAGWIDRHRRDNLLEHYKHLLSLFVVHGVFFENYNFDDEHEIAFINEILRPACEYVEATFGFKPLIAQIFPTEPESYNFWISYPKKVLDITKGELRGVL